jgi:DNA mismatch repair protein MutL
VNGRAVRDRLVQHALVDVYRDVLPRGRFPSAILFLDLPTERVDGAPRQVGGALRPPAVHRAVRAVSRGLARRWLDAAATGATAVGGPPPLRLARRPGRAPPGDCSPRRRRPPTALPAIGAEPLLRGQRLLGQLLATYLVLETGAASLVNQHASHERVLYEGCGAVARARGGEPGPAGPSPSA